MRLGASSYCVLLAGQITITTELDLNAGLTQVLSDGVNTYVYGYTRLAQVNDAETGYFLTDALGSVRQVTDSTGAITLVRDYSPYGETVQTLGDFQTDFSFTGEMTDASGLVYLRARYYDPATGRFVSRDTWEGEYRNPLSLGKWNYSENNPVNRIDPTGHYWWGPGQALYDSSLYRLQGQNIHVRIQAMAMEGQDPIIHAEYPIPPLGTKVDLLDSQTGEVWEIKPWAERGQAAIEVGARVVALESAKYEGLLKGMNPVAMLYDWNEIPPLWIEGFMFDTEVYLGTDETEQYQIWAGQVSPGVIAWWKHKNPNTVPVTVPIYVPYAMKNSDRNVRTGWSPRGALQPAPAFMSNLDVAQAGEYSLYLLGLYAVYKLAEAIVCPPLVFVTP